MFRSMFIVFVLWASIFTGKVLAQSTPALSEVKSFAFVIGLEEEDLRNQLGELQLFDLIVIDGELASAQLVADLQSGGAIVLGYLSVGTIEKGRFWYRRVRRFRLDLWGDWGEWYANVNRRRFRKILTTKVLPSFLDKGFDGIFLDNVDMISSHRRQRRGMRKLMNEISEIVRSKGNYLFAQNGDDEIFEFASSLDGWNREDVSFTYDFDSEAYVPVSAEDHEAAIAALRKYRDAGLLVTSTDYLSERTGMLAGDAVLKSCAAGAVPTVSDIELTTVGSPILCD